jgi:hypothetical protein
VRCTTDQHGLQSRASVFPVVNSDAKNVLLLWDLQALHKYCSNSNKSTDGMFLPSVQGRRRQDSYSHIEKTSRVECVKDSTSYTDRFTHNKLEIEWAPFIVHDQSPSTGSSGSTRSTTCDADNLGICHTPSDFRKFSTANRANQLYLLTVSHVVLQSCCLSWRRSNIVENNNYGYLSRQCWQRMHSGPLEPLKSTWTRAQSIPGNCACATPYRNNLKPRLLPTVVTTSHNCT